MGTVQNKITGKTSEEVAREAAALKADEEARQARFAASTSLTPPESPRHGFKLRQKIAWSEGKDDKTKGIIIGWERSSGRPVVINLAGEEWKVKEDSMPRLITQLEAEDRKDPKLVEKWAKVANLSLIHI